MSYGPICVAILLIQPVIPIDMKMKSSDKYGPYILSKSEAEICRGPKLLDQAVVACNITMDANNVTTATFFYNISQTVKLDEIKITVYNIKNNRKNVMWNYRLVDPCHHFAVGSVLARHLHMKPENCIVKPGLYNFDVNLTETVQSFYGHSFFYGDYFIKTICLSKKGNLGCLIVHQVFEKKI